jgi:hypothetical protein
MNIKINADSTHTLEHHFKDKKGGMKPLFDVLIDKLSKEMDFEFKIGKTYIGLIKKLVFAAVRVQNNKIVFEIVARKEFNSSRIVKSVKFQKERWAQYVELKEPSDIDQELIDWVKFSYE